LRQINAAASSAAHIACMIRFAKYQSVPAAPPQQPDTVRDIPDEAAIVPAAWPATTSVIRLPQTFWPNAPSAACAKQART
jgi:hypothetical protein